ncbi:MAG: hypothetical protein ABI255_11505 [Microbacteriaceae bacterium]
MAIPSRDDRIVRERVSAAARHRQLGIDQDTVDRAAEVVANALAGGGGVTRAELMTLLEGAGITTTGQRGYHLILLLAQRGLPTIVTRNRIAGTWTRAIGSARLRITPHPFASLSVCDRAGFTRAARAYGRFVGTAVTVACDADLLRAGREESNTEQANATSDTYRR